MPAELEVTLRVKNAVRRWAGLDETDPLVLEDNLDDLRPPQTRAILRTRLNQEFVDETCFPITTAQWTILVPKQKTVRDVRDEVRRRRETGKCGP